ncbi:hypothetical protein SGLAD_v1c02170 [Spiroplasma gladiatoris]|uniref:Lipoprotein n=1 Tax=Spiroplasma gladiatoris TaxID=2143 RepID=A0A4P7AIE6_9MOLU|nr:hypothetical protein [Spiroplasma gladiatoris]QBQ07416.1 hypothetical protein SGLAD_v1c02170 [Spiroplasma gladiatoris]
MKKVLSFLSAIIFNVSIFSTIVSCGTGKNTLIGEELEYIDKKSDKDLCEILENEIIVDKSLNYDYEDSNFLEDKNKKIPGSLIDKKFFNPIKKLFKQTTDLKESSLEGNDREQRFITIAGKKKDIEFTLNFVIYRVFSNSSNYKFGAEFFKKIKIPQE